MGVIVSLSERALADLSGIRDYLLPLSAQGAEGVRRAIAETIDLLGAYPMVGRETDIPRVRVLPVVRYPYLIYHTVLDEEVVICDATNSGTHRVTQKNKPPTRPPGSRRTRAAR